ncbi:rod shape-determining protein RodA, partial [bacterium]|nr:rod shape-determining protein RodA [bacterium]
MGIFQRNNSSFYSPFAERRFQSRVERRMVRFDWTIAVLVLVLMGIGIMNLYSAVAGYPERQVLFSAQMRWFVACMILMVPIYLINYHFYEATAPWAYAMTSVFLLLTLFFGRVLHGSSRWLNIGGFSFQPSEFSKIALVLILARYFAANPKHGGYTLRELKFPLTLMLVPTALIFFEPDLGTAMIHVLIFLSIAVFVGLEKKTVAAVVGFVLLIAPIGWFFLLKDYQKSRILTVIDPSVDPQGAGYQITQSAVAIGSGKFFGKGYLQGTQTKLRFLPEQHTDFVFSVLSEEWGLIGAVLVLALFFLLIAWGLSVASNSKDRFGSIAAFGLAAMLFWHVIINIGMALGLMPVVGVILPFFS